MKALNKSCKEKKKEHRIDYLLLDFTKLERP